MPIAIDSIKFLLSKGKISIAKVALEAKLGTCEDHNDYTMTSSVLEAILCEESGEAMVEDEDEELDFDITDKFPPLTESQLDSIISQPFAESIDEILLPTQQKVAKSYISSSFIKHKRTVVPSGIFHEKNTIEQNMRILEITDPITCAKEHPRGPLIPFFLRERLASTFFDCNLSHISLLNVSSHAPAALSYVRIVLWIFFELYIEWAEASDKFHHTKHSSTSSDNGIASNSHGLPKPYSYIAQQMVLLNPDSESVSNPSTSRSGSKSFVKSGYLFHIISSSLEICIGILLECAMVGLCQLDLVLIAISQGLKIDKNDTIQACIRKIYDTLSEEKSAKGQSKLF
ncbi:hypothetical protein ADUPG1_012065 [Aduncisulcus paluster]|uniref:Uncharacterized protein n=1 Tax=Aduncisulcus paluster TaxID=2918883 RepID=A0ABQ5JY49_9EUKA|nr:hypothetical protein ADUPG1_012065 [Aduncisulcus paluster]